MNLRKNTKKLLATTMAVVIATAGLVTILPVQAAFPGVDYRIAYSKLAVSEAGMNAALATNSLEGDNEQEVIDSTEYGFMAARFSADGEKMTYSQLKFDGDRSGDVFVSNADGSDPINVSNIDTGNYPNADIYQALYSSFSPDGSRVVFGEYRQEAGVTSCHLFIVNSDGTNKEQLTSDSNFCDLYPVFSPDGQKIAFVRTTEELVGEETVGSNHIYIMDANGDNPQRVYTYAGRDEKVDSQMAIMMAMITFDGGQVSPVDWSPNGNKILFSETFFNSEDTYTSRIATVDLSGDDVDVIKTTPTIDPEMQVLPTYGQAQFSPEGNIIYKEIIITEPESEENARVELYIRTADGDGSNVQQVLYRDFPTMSGEALSFAVLGYSLPTVYTGSDDGDTETPSATVVNPENNAQVTLEGSACDSFTDVSAVTESSQDKQDAQYAYPSSLVAFTLEGCDVGGNVEVTLYFEDLEPSQAYVARKFNSNTGTYSTITDAEITATTVSGQPVTQLRYTLKDGGELDLDGIANGTIVDPVGLGVVAAQDAFSGQNAGGTPLASTGANIATLFIAAFSAIAGGAMVLGRKLYS